MATVQDKMEAVAYWVAGSLLCFVMAVFGGPLWSIVQTVNDGFHIAGDAGLSNLHAVQSVPMQYYGFLVAWEIAIIVRTAFVVWSSGSYESGF